MSNGAVSCANFPGYRETDDHGWGQAVCDMDEGVVQYCTHREPEPGNPKICVHASRIQHDPSLSGQNRQWETSVIFWGTDDRREEYVGVEYNDETIERFPDHLDEYADQYE